MSVCPFCQRRLLSTASPACNWCGKEIPDAAYQQSAAAKRDALSVQQALHDAASLAAIEGLNMGGPWLSPFGLMGGPQFPINPMPRHLPPLRPPLVQPLVQPSVPPVPVEEPVTEEPTESRFRHLEL
jgi:hypothetical protein